MIFLANCLRKGLLIGERETERERGCFIIFLLVQRDSLELGKV